MFPIVEFKNISKSFGDNHVLVDANLSIIKGETITILGGSGTGKTVYLKLLLGVMRPDSGSVMFRGQNLGDMEERQIISMRKHIGMLFQGSALFDSLTVAENIAYPLREHFDYDEDKIAQIVAHRLSMVGLEGIEEMMPAELSGGMKKRVGLARAIATDPDVILYDEPTTGLDPANTKRICRLIMEMQQKLKVTSIVVTHDMEAAFTVTDRMALLHGKRFHFIGTKDEARASNDPIVQGFIRGEMDTGDG